MDLTPAQKIANEVYERWRLTPNRDAYVAAIVRQAAEQAWEAARKEFEFDPDVVVPPAERDVRYYRLVPIEEG